MNISRGSLSTVVAACAAAVLLIVPRQVSGQEVLSRYQEASEMANQGKFAEAAAAYQSIVKDFDANGITEFGPQFGAIHYQLGRCLMLLKKWPEAATAFETCYKKYYKPKGEGRKSINVFRNVALVQWGLCMQAQEDYEEAAKIYEKFLTITDKDDRKYYNAWRLLANLSICHTHAERLGKGATYLQRGLDNLHLMTPPDQRYLYRAFLPLVGQWIDKKKAADALKFLHQNDGLLRISPAEMHRSKYNLHLMKHAQDAVNAELDSLAVRLFSFIALTDDAMADAEDRLTTERDPKQRKAYADLLSQLKGEINSGKQIEIKALQLLSWIYEKRGNFRTSYAVYDELATNYPAAVNDKGEPFHPDLVYRAARAAFAYGDILSAQYHGLIFLEKYPTHKLKPDVEQLLLDHLFLNQEYERSLEIATNVLPQATPGSAVHDIALFVKGGSLYFLGEYEEADPLLLQHVKEYPKSKYVENSTYYYASNKVKLLAFAEGGDLLEKWLAEYPETVLRPYALLDRAMAHFGLDELDPTLARIEELEAKHPDTELLDSALNLRGDVQQAKSLLAEAEKSYKRALELAESQAHDGTAAESVKQLIKVTDGLERFKDVVSYYDHFQERYPGDLREPEAVAFSLRGLIEEGRGKEGLQKMEDIIIGAGENKNADLEKALSAYAQNYIDGFDAGKLVERLKELPTVRPVSEPVRAWLIVLRIDTLEKEFKNEDKTAEIKVAFNELKTFKKEDLAGYVLQRIALYLFVGGNKELAVEWAEEILSREGLDGKDTAYYILGETFSASANKERKLKGVEMFQKMIAEFGNPELMDDSVAGIGRVYTSLKDWSNAEAAWFKYIENKSLRKHSPEAWNRLGEARDKQGKINPALSAYSQLFKYKGNLRWSAPAFRRSAELQWNKGDKRKAYDIVKLVYQSMNHLKDNPEDKDRDIARMEGMYFEWKSELGIKDDKK